ncbi:MAG TPA: hypothetical protein VGN09_22870 [Vicinamibacteria bacterium]|jgi:hypothetical protein
MYEHRHAPLAPRAVFLRRLGEVVALSAGLVVASLAVGMWGYQHFEHLAWRDAFLNAAMLLGGMGPVETPVTPGGKLFAGFYALYAGLILLVSVGIALTPIFHRLMHKFHLEEEDEG